ncbi:MAG TPA: molybdopterin-dependent oxidoreductase, partial [Fluviicoccus sp.]|nr:molybdopterin-dependent oxidoreductase [Fluviicoccus sp.]
MTFKYASEILPRAYGFPMKIRVPTKLGFKNPKYVVSMEVTNDYKGGYWRAPIASRPSRWPSASGISAISPEAIATGSARRRRKRWSADAGASTTNGLGPDSGFVLVPTFLGT